MAGLVTGFVTAVTHVGVPSHMAAETALTVIHATVIRVNMAAPATRLKLSQTGRLTAGALAVIKADTAV